MTAATQTPMPQARHRLEPGDRVPDFILADQTGLIRPFYQRVSGRGMVVFVDSTPALRQSLADLREAYRAAELECLVIDTTAAGVEPWPCTLADEAGRICRAFREMSGHGTPGGAPLAVLLDRNQRILALSDRGDPAQWALARWSEEAPLTPAGEIRHVAPVLTVPNVLTPADCRAVIARWHEMGHEPGKVTSMVEGEEVRRVYEDLKKRRDHRLNDPEVRKPLMAMIARRLGPELTKAFCFGSFRFDRVLIACYDAERGDYFKRHRDNTAPSTLGRRFALTINLNSDEYEGGELIFPEYGDYRYKPPAGAAVLFSSSLLHEALPVTRGQRFALLSFLLDLDQQPAKR
jgi:predicted 2-oxoglutarate/Fe(II)-dependent dioxygenase YbiX